jgi:hypothetical protein
MFQGHRGSLNHILNEKQGCHVEEFTTTGKNQGKKVRFTSTSNLLRE